MWYRCVFMRFPHAAICHLSIFRHECPRWEVVAGVIFLAWLFSLIRTSLPPTTPFTNIPWPTAEPEGREKSAQEREIRGCGGNPDKQGGKTSHPYYYWFQFSVFTNLHVMHDKHIKSVNKCPIFDWIHLS